MDLTSEPAPDTVRTRRDEMPPPVPTLPELLQLVAGLLEVHRQELVYSRERMPTLLDLGATEVPSALDPGGPASLRTATKRQITKALGKWSALAFLLPIAGGYLVKRWPEYADLVAFVTGWLP